MDLLKSWVAGFLVWAAGFVAQSYLLSTAGTVERLGEVGWRVLLVHLPWLALMLATAAVAALVHGSRAGRRRHAVAALTVPVLALLLSLVLGLGATQVGSLIANLVAGAVGAVAGWQLVDRLRHGDTPTAPY